MILIFPGYNIIFGVSLLPVTTDELSLMVSMNCAVLYLDNCSLSSMFYTKTL